MMNNKIFSKALMKSLMVSMFMALSIPTYANGPHRRHKKDDFAYKSEMRIQQKLDKLERKEAKRRQHEMEKFERREAKRRKDHYAIGRVFHCLPARGRYYYEGNRRYWLADNVLYDIIRSKNNRVKYVVVKVIG